VSAVPAPRGPDTGTYRVPAVERGFRVLRLLAERSELSLAQIVELTGLHKSTAHYLLRTLVAVNAVQYDEPRRVYQLGPGLVELGAAAADQMNDLSIAKRYLGELLERMELTIVLYRRISPTEVMLVDKMERPHRVRITLQVGSPVPIQGGSFGRVFLAHDEPKDVAAALAGGVHPFTTKSVSSREAFLRELEPVRQRGFAVDHEGFALGVSTVAAPIFDERGAVRLVAAGVGFTSAMDDERAQGYGRLLRDTCDRITRTLHGRSDLVAGRGARTRTERGARG
jgi:DNA-binding IclR family transcriptional regulator